MPKKRSEAERRPPIGVHLRLDIEQKARRQGVSYNARARWMDPLSGRRAGTKRTFHTLEAAEQWLESLHTAAATGIDPGQTLASFVSTSGDRWARAIDPTS